MLNQYTCQIFIKEFHIADPENNISQIKFKLLL